MTDSKHTPGPWIADNGKVYALDETGQVYRFSVMIIGGWRVFRGERPTENELYTNARLIAATPDLLEALQNASGLLDTPISRRLYDGSDFYQETIKSIRTAIAKATKDTD